MPRKSKDRTLRSARKAQVEAILQNSYCAELRPNGDGTYFARVLEFPGCMTEGKNELDALKNLKDAMRAWVTVRLQDGDPIPQPLDDIRFSGKFLVRVPRSVHRELSHRADLEGVSLNQYVLTALVKAVA